MQRYTNDYGTVKTVSLSVKDYCIIDNISKGIRSAWLMVVISNMVGLLPYSSAGGGNPEFQSFAPCTYSYYMTTTTNIVITSVCRLWWFPNKKSQNF